jgi:uncharacterized protein (TIRG00374 family)
MKRSILSVMLGLGLSVVGVLLAARYVQEPPSITSYWPIAAGVGAMLVAWLLQGAVIALLARPQLKSVRVLDMTRIYLATQAAGAVTPFAGGEVAYQLLELDRRGLSPEIGGAIITLRSLLNGVVFFTAAVVGLILVPNIPFLGRASSLLPSEHAILIGTAITIAVIGLLIAAFVAYRRRSQRRREGHGWMGSISAKIPEWREKAVDYLRHVRESLVWIWRQESRVVIACLGLMVLYWAIYPLLGTMALRAAGWDGTGWFAVFMAQYVLFIVIPLSPTPGNSGAAELAFVALMGDYAPQSALLSGVIIWRVLNHYSELMVGAFIAGRHLPEDIKVAKQAFGSDSDSEPGSESDASRNQS